MKIVRFGNTETHLLICYYLLKYENLPEHITSKLTKLFDMFTNYLYSDSGYYDKKVPGNVFNFNKSAYTSNYFKYISELETACGGCEEFQVYGSEIIHNILNQYIDKFKIKYNIGTMKNLNGTLISDRIDYIYKCIKDKKLLVVSSFGGLAQKQYDCGNIYKIYPKFPKLKSLEHINFPYCFNNNGPHENYFETSNYMWEKIKEKDFDIALLSCAAFGHILTHKIHSELKKDAIYVGGNIQEIFGIASKREKEAGNIKPNEYWITTIPDEYIPKNCVLPEGGCFW